MGVGGSSASGSSDGESQVLLAERHLSPEEADLNRAAASVREATEIIPDLADFRRRLEGSKWKVMENRFGIELQTTDGEFRVQVFVGFPSGVTVRRWSNDSAAPVPAQKTSFETSVSVYPDYLDGNPIFDDLRQNGGSGMNCFEITQILAEVAGVLKV